jgi:hypothetical protein
MMEHIDIENIDETKIKTYSHYDHIVKHAKDMLDNPYNHLIDKDIYNKYELLENKCLFCLDNVKEKFVFNAIDSSWYVKE